VRPFCELDFGQELRLHPYHVAAPHARHLGRFRERRRVALERLQPLEQALDLRLGEPGPDIADPAQVALVVHAEHQ
jgi:hypothetical protein